MDSGIYIIRNRKTNAYYLGSSKHLHMRHSQHLNKLMNGKHHSYKLQEAWDRGQPSDFQFIIICYCFERDLFTFEQQYLDNHWNWEHEFLNGARYNVSDRADCKDILAKKGLLKPKKFFKKKKKDPDEKPCKRSSPRASRGVAKTGEVKVKHAKGHGRMRSPFRVTVRPVK